MSASLRRSFFAAVAALVAPFAKAQREATLDAAAMIEAIAAVESGNNRFAIGQKGERGRCQFMPATWQRYTNAPLAFAANGGDFVRKIERAHLDTVCRELRRQGLALDPALIAAAWRFGVRHAARQVRADSAQRTANFYWDLLERRRTAR